MTDPDFEQWWTTHTTYKTFARTLSERVWLAARACERERCAGIAENSVRVVLKANSYRGKPTAVGSFAADVAAEIAAAIRDGGGAG